MPIISVRFIDAATKINSGAPPDILQVHRLMSGEIDVSKIDLTQLNSHLVERWPSPLQLQDCR